MKKAHTLSTNSSKGEVGEVTLVAFNAGLQVAVDETDRTWHVDYWEDGDGVEIMDRWANPDQPARDTTPNVNWEAWEGVEFVTCYSDFPEGRRWTHFRPDDFDQPTEG